MLEIGNREVFNEDKHCSCSMPEWDIEMLRTGAQYIEQSAIKSDDDRTAESLDGTIRAVQVPMDAHAIEGMDEQVADPADSMPTRMLGDVDTTMITTKCTINEDAEAVMDYVTHRKQHKYGRG